jgi:hypothetical protein
MQTPSKKEQLAFGDDAGRTQRTHIMHAPLAPPRLAPPRLAPRRLAPRRLAPRRLAPRRLAPRHRCWSFAPFAALLAVLACAAQFQPPALSAETIPVRYLEGSVHGFLVLRTTEGKTIAVGDLIQLIRGDRVIARLTFRFKDGSIDDETTVFSQRGNFRLLTDHHVQKGPSFPHPLDTSIDALSGQVIVRSTDKDGKEKVTTDHLDLPADLANGLVLSLVKNIRPDAPETKVPMLVATPKPRIIQLVFSSQGEEPLSIAGSHRKAMRFAVKIELGGVAGVVAPLIGKQPKDIQIWILGGKAPAFVREEGQLYEGGPIWSIQLAAPVWPQASHTRQ